MPGNQHNDWGHSDVGGKLPDQNATEVKPQDGANAGNASGGQQNQQNGASASSSGIYTNFEHASPESNVNPAGAPQNSHGSASGPLPGGVDGQYQASQNAQAAGNPGSRQGSSDAARIDDIRSSLDDDAPADKASR